MYTPTEIYNQFLESDHGQEVWNEARETYPDYNFDYEERSSATEFILENIVDLYGLHMTDEDEQELFDMIIEGLS